MPRYYNGCGPFGGLDEYDNVLKRAKQYFRWREQFVMLRGLFTWTSCNAYPEDLARGSTPDRILYVFRSGRWHRIP